ncbi:chaplin ChpG, partial [Streptomyces rubrogriseus]|nr:chaplin ChpG [Streptomyces rubrogriseus]
MSRIAKGLALTSVAAAAVAGTAGVAAADSGAQAA